MKLLLLEIDNVLYDSNLLKGIAREWALTAMKEAGFPVDYDTAMSILKDIIRDKGEDYPYHFNELMLRLGLKEDHRVIAAGVIAYHDVKRAFLKPIPGIIEAILLAREASLKVGVISSGDSVKEWEKIIRLGVHHLINSAWIGPRSSLGDVFSSGFDPKETILIANSEKRVREAEKLGVKFLILLTDNGAEIIEEGKSREVYEAWRIGAAVKSLLRKL